MSDLPETSIYSEFDPARQLEIERDEARAEAARLKEALRGIADMPDYDQDNEYRLRHMAKRALEETK